AFERAQAAQIDGRGGLEIVARPDFRPVGEIDVKARPRPDLEIGREINDALRPAGAFQDLDAAAAPMDGIGRVGVYERAGGEYRLTGAVVHLLGSRRRRKQEGKEEDARNEPAGGAEPEPHGQRDNDFPHRRSAPLSHRNPRGTRYVSGYVCNPHGETAWYD